MLSFGVTVLPDPPYSRLIELTKLAESHGFEYGWTYDSHVLWQESMPVMALLADQTSTIKLGHMVTNPATRDPTVLASAYATLQDISNGRMIMGIGRGDSAVRFVGRKPMKVADFEEALQMIKPFMNGREVTWNEKELQLKWVRPELPEIEMHVAGYGPKALAVAGRQGDGVIIQLADPDIIQWIMDTARKAATEAGRDPAALKCIVSAPSHISDDLADAREQVRWFPAMVSNHVQDLIDRYGTDGSVVPKVLTDYVEARKFYDYSEHSRVGAKHGEFVTDEICDRFCVLGNSEQATAKLRELESIGVDQFNIYLMTHGQEETLEAYGKDILPQFSRRSRHKRARERGGLGRLRAGLDAAARAAGAGEPPRDRAAARAPRRSARRADPRARGRARRGRRAAAAGRRRPRRGGADRQLAGDAPGGRGADRPSGEPDVRGRERGVDRLRRRVVRPGRGALRADARPRRLGRLRGGVSRAATGRAARVRRVGDGAREPVGLDDRPDDAAARPRGAVGTGRTRPVSARRSRPAARLLASSGFDQPQLESVEIEMRYESPAQYWEVTRDLSSMFRTTLERLTKPERERFERAVAEALEPYANADGISLPGRAWVAAADRA